ncbi:MAG TPA: SulP family inorganic anion transporter, partial [Glycomyces sp.]|nr:SulP family inorganic anion transporter [Glycomyces sp.]
MSDHAGGTSEPELVGADAAGAPAKVVRSPSSRSAPARGLRPPFDDVVAGLTVALVLIPQSVAYAALAGLPPSAGLVAAIFPPIVAAVFASSPYLQTGPTALASLLTLGILSSLVPPGST